jgi:hypothetical protein
MPGLGRIHIPDEGDRTFLLDDGMVPVAKRANHLWAFFDQTLNQGDTGTCVGHGWKHWLMTAPIIQSDAADPPAAMEIYDACTQVDEFPENDHDTERQMGTSVRAGAKVLQTQGFLTEYRWCWNASTSADWLAGMDADGRFVGGPLVIGVNFYSGMFQIDAEGFMRVSGTLAGGHCMCLIGWNEKRGFAYGLNSWGHEWGRNGRFYMAGEDLERLLHEGGEACSAAEVRRVG